MEHVGNQLGPCGFAGNNRIRRRLKIPVPKGWKAARNYKHFVYVKIYTLSAEVLVGDFFGCSAYSLLGVVWCLISLIMISEFQGISWIPQNRSGNRVVCLILFSSKRHCEERSYGKVLHHGKWKAGIVVMVICMFCNVCIIILYSQLISFIRCVHLRRFFSCCDLAFALYSTFKSLRQKLRKNLTLKVPPSVSFSPNTTDSQVARMCKLQSSLKDCQFEPQIWFDIDGYYILNLWKSMAVNHFEPRPSSENLQKSHRHLRVINPSQLDIKLWQEGWP